MTFYGTPLPTKRMRLPQSRSQSHFAAADTSRLYADFNSSSITTDAALRSELVTIRNRSRELARSEDYMRALIIACKNNIVGPNGFTLQMDVRDSADRLNPDGAPDDLANDAIEAAFDEWSKPENFTTARNICRADFEKLAVETAVRDGEFLFEVAEGFDNPFAFALRPFNADYLDETRNEIAPSGQVVSLGVERNKWQEPVALYLRSWNPGDMFFTSRGPTMAYRSERFQIANYGHVFVPLDFEQSRGIPWAHVGSNRLKMLSGYEEAALEAARGAACKHEFLERPMDATGEFTGEGRDVEGNWLDTVEPGTREILPVGWKANSIDPKYPHTEHKPFIAATLQGIAAGQGISYMTLTGDLSQTSYSSGRIGLLSERDIWRALQTFFIGCLYFGRTKVFSRWLKMALTAGAAKMPNGSALPLVKFDKFNRPIFAGRGWDWVDPEKDQKANEAALRNKLTTRGAIVSKQGGDLETTFRTLQRESRLAAKYGVKLPEEMEMAATAPVEPMPAMEPE